MELNNLSNLSHNNMNNSTNLSNINNDSSLISLNNKDIKKDNLFDDLIKNKSINNTYTITIEKILFQTRVTMLNSIYLLIIILITVSLIFCIYYIYKLVISLLFTSNFQNIINDFKALSLQYNNIVRYWIEIKQLFILPNSHIHYDLNKTEEHFIKINNNINNIYKNRIKNYRLTSTLYDCLFNISSDKNLSNIDFCFGYKRCNQIKNSNRFLLSNGIESTINLYAKEISNYYKDFKRIKNNIKNKNDIKNYFIDDKYKILSSNINHIIIYIEELFFNHFYNDEKEIVNDFYLKIKILNIIEVCYCALLNIVSIFFVYNFINRIIHSVEETSNRINNSIRRMKISAIEEKI
jgi:hypothetical protein